MFGEARLYYSSRRWKGFTGHLMAIGDRQYLRQRRLRQHRNQAVLRWPSLPEMRGGAMHNSAANGKYFFLYSYGKARKSAATSTNQECAIFLLTTGFLYFKRRRKYSSDQSQSARIKDAYPSLGGHSHKSLMPISASKKASLTKSLERAQRRRKAHGPVVHG